MPSDHLSAEDLAEIRTDLIARYERKERELITERNRLRAEVAGRDGDHCLCGCRFDDPTLEAIKRADQAEAERDAWRSAACTAFEAVLPGYEPTPDDAVAGIAGIRQYGDHRAAEVERLRAALDRVKKLADQYARDGEHEGYGGELWTTTAAALDAALAGDDNGCPCDQLPHLAVHPDCPKHGPFANGGDQT
jgi:hypothetical protein